MTAEGTSRARPWLLVLAYLSVLGFVVLAATRDREARWHARNGLLLFAAVAVTGGVATIIGILAPSLACLYAVAMLIVSTLYVLIVVLAVVKAVQGQRLMIPGISTHADRLSASD